MAQIPLDPTEWLKKMTSESVKQGENVRNNVRDLTLRALQQRELSLKHIKQVLGNVTEGASAGLAKGKLNVEKTMSDVIDGMDEALLKAVEANRIALEKVAEAGKDFNDSYVKKALTELEKLEDEFLNSVKQASAGASDKVQAQWGELLKSTKMTGTQAGAQATQLLEHYGEQMKEGVRQTRAAGLQTAHALSQNFATFASGILTGLSEAMQASKKK
jgi:hypothetical protein